MWRRLHFIFNFSVHVLNILVRNVKRCIYFIVKVPSFWLVIKMFSLVGCVSSERWKRIQAAQVLSKSVFLFEVHLS